MSTKSKKTSNAKTKKIKEKIITVVGANYVELLVADLLDKSFKSYKRRDFNEKSFQTSPMENVYATAGIVLTLISLESFRNRIYYLNNKTTRDVSLNKIGVVFKDVDSVFPDKVFSDLVSELMIIRDIIVHNHIYEVEIVKTEGYEYIEHSQKILDYGDKKRFKSGLVDEKNSKTKNLFLNVQPALIGFEDLFKVLVIFDLFIGISNFILNKSYTPFNFYHLFKGTWIDSLSNYLSYFYSNSSNDLFYIEIKKILNPTCSTFIRFLSPYHDYFLTNTCIKCKEYGYKQQNKRKCFNCGWEISLLNP